MEVGRPLVVAVAACQPRVHIPEAESCTLHRCPGQVARRGGEGYRWSPLLSSCGLQPNQRARLGHGAQDKTLGDICCHSCTPLSPKQVYEDHFSRSHEVDQCLKSKPFQKKMGSIGMNGRKRQNLRNNNIFLAEGSFIAKTSGNRGTADHVVPTGGRCQHRAPWTFGDTSYYYVMEIHTGTHQLASKESYRVKPEWREGSPAKDIIGGF